MKRYRFTLDSPTGATVNVYAVEPTGVVRGILLLLHGLAEHAGRYDDVATLLAERGIAVFAPDHRGHGSTAALDAPLRRFAKKNGALKVVADTHAVLVAAKERCSDHPVAVFGHSMGALIALNLAIRHGRELAGLAAWNAGLQFGWQERLAVTALKVEKALKGSDVASAVFMRATIDAWGRSIQPQRSRSDWLTHDREAVLAFDSDPLCGWSPTVSMAEDFVAFVRHAADEKQLGKIPRDLPIHLLGGTQDPATRGGQSTTQMAGLLRHVGCRNVSVEIVEGARHETLNEIEPMRGQALASLEGWLDRVLPNA